MDIDIQKIIKMKLFLLTGLLFIFLIVGCTEEEYNTKKCNELYNNLIGHEQEFNSLKGISIYNFRTYIWRIVWHKHELDSLLDKKMDQDLQFWFEPNEVSNGRVKMIYVEETKNDYINLFELDSTKVVELEKKATPIIITHLKIKSKGSKSIGNSMVFYSSVDSIGLIYNPKDQIIDSCAPISPNWYYFNTSIKFNDKQKRKIEKRIKDLK
jgi:hypothetical protein